MIRVMLVEEQKVIREGLKILLEAESDIKVVGSVSNPDTAISKLKELNPNIVLISMALTEVEGFDFIKTIQQQFNKIKIIIFCNQVDASDFVQYLELGVKGCLLKNISVGEIKEVIHYINKGYTHIGENVFKTVIPELSDAISALQIVDSESNKTLESPAAEVIIDDKFQFEALGSSKNNHKNYHNSFAKNNIPPSSSVMEADLAPMTNAKTPIKSSWLKRGITSFALVSLGLFAIAIANVSSRRGTAFEIQDAIVNGKIVSIDSPIKGKVQEIIDGKGRNIKVNEVLAIIEVSEDKNNAQIISQLEKDITLKQEQIKNSQKILTSLDKNLKLLPKKNEISIKIPETTEATKISIDNAREIANLEQQIINQKVTINLLEKELSNLQSKLVTTKEDALKTEEIPIKSPISGAIYNTNYAVGEFITPSKEIVTLVDCRNLWVEAIVESKVAAKINLPKDVSVQLADQETSIPGKITLIESLGAQNKITNSESIASSSTVPINNVNNNNESFSRVIVNLDFPNPELTPQNFCNVGLNAKISVNK